MAEQALAPVWSREPRSMPDMRRLAKRVVDGMPRVQAAVLFGSRARKTARRDSDWDVALLAPERYKEEVLRAAPRIPSVSYVSLSPKKLRERHNRLGTLERSVVKDGVLLAGEWTIPKSQEKPAVDYDDLAGGLQAAADQLMFTVNQLRLVIKRQPEYGDRTLAGQSQYASELLTKAALLHLEVDYPRVHRFLLLAEALGKKYPNHAWIETIKSLNGKSHDLHVAEYGSATLESVDKSLIRLNRAIKFFGKVLEAIAKDRPDFKERLQTLCSNIVDIVLTIQEDDIYWKKYPDGLKQLLLQWKQIAAKYMEMEPDDKHSGGN